MRRGVASFVLLLPLVLACTADAPEPGPTVGLTFASAGCGGAPPLAPGTSSPFSMRVDELDRKYLVHLPPDYDPTRPMPLMLDFHGYTGTAAGEETYTGLSVHADEHGYIVVYPQGTGFPGDTGQLMTSWNDLAGNQPEGPDGPICSETADKYPYPPECGEPQPCVWATCHDDLAFIARLLDQLELDLCIDLDRVYATGMSAGGMFVHRLGCNMAERFAAIAPVGGTLARGFNCAPELPLAMMNIYGARDAYVSQRGDMSSDGYFYLGADAVLAKWAGEASQSCDAETTPYPTSRDGDLDLTCIQHDNCATGTEVVHCTWDGEHDWPQAEGMPVGNDVIWEFFSRHSRAQSP